MSFPDVLQSAASAKDPCKSTFCVSVLQSPADVNGVLSNNIFKKLCKCFFSV